MNTSKPNPHTTKSDTVITSPYDEIEPPKRVKRSKAKPHPRSNHRHLYEWGWYSYQYTFPLDGIKHSWWIYVEYCTICGRTFHKFYERDKTPPIGSTIFPELSGHFVDINNSYILTKENVL